MNKTCLKCSGRCCRYFSFEIDAPGAFEEFENVRWYLCHRGISVHVDKGRWYICIENRCNKLASDNSCRIYDDRPMICRKYKMEACDFTGGDYGFQQHFRTPEQLEAYARKKLGEKAYQKVKGRALAKAERKPANRTKKKKVHNGGA